jgi:hypothetical protein
MRRDVTSQTLALAERDREIAPRKTFQAQGSSHSEFSRNSVGTDFLRTTTVDRRLGIDAVSVRPRGRSVGARPASVHDIVSVKASAQGVSAASRDDLSGRGRVNDQQPRGVSFGEGQAGSAGASQNRVSASISSLEEAQRGY